MSQQDQKKSTVGPPIWVETIASPEEYAWIHKTYPSTTHTSKPPLFNPTIHEGGRWRYKMGGGLAEEEIKNFNSNLEKLRELLTTKKFQQLKGQYGDAKLT